MFVVDGIRLLVLLFLVGFSIWSAIDTYGASSAPPIGAKKDGNPVGSANGVRKLEPNFKACGEGDVSTPAYKDAMRVKCSAVVREATIDAQTRCSEYLQNEADCRQERNSHCESQRENVEGCLRLVVVAALARAGVQFKGTA